jgi:3-oxoisoapionate decarboxylase
MQLGIGSYAYAWAIGVPGYPTPERPLGVLGLLDKAAALGVSLVQAADNLPLEQLAPDDLAAFGAHARALGIEVEVGTRGIASEHLMDCLRVAEKLRARLLRVVVDTAQHQPGPDEVVATLHRVLPTFESAGVCLAIENHDRFPCKVLARMVERLASPAVGICLDTVNSFGALEGPAFVVETLGPWVVNLHVKDFVIRRAAHKMGFTIEGSPAGAGQLDIPWLVGTLRSLGRDPNAILELWPPPEATLAETIAKEDIWARQSITALRTLIPTQR